MLTDLIEARRQLELAKGFCVERGARDCIDLACVALERATEQAKDYERRIAALDATADELASMLVAEQEVTDAELEAIFAD